MNKKIMLLAAGSMCFQIAQGMSREHQFIPSGEPARMPLPYLGELQEYINRCEQVSLSSSSIASLEVDGENKRKPDLDPSLATKRQFSDQAIQELLKTKLSICLSDLNEKNLRVLQGLEKIGVLVIMRSYQTAIPVNWVKLIEKYFPHILDLTLDGLGLKDDQFRQLAHSGIAAQLRILSVKYNGDGITAQEFTKDNLDRFESLERLEVSLNRIGDAGFKVLALTKMATRLKCLSISSCGITAQEFTKENLDRFESLKRLNACQNRIGDAGFKSLALSKGAASLKELGIGWCGITAQEFTRENLDKFKSLESLTIIRGNELGENAIRVLMQSDLCQTLREVRYSSDASNLLKNICRIGRR